jgi:hypothetical protein
MLFQNFQALGADAGTYSNPMFSFIASAVLVCLTIMNGTFAAIAGNFIFWIYLNVCLTSRLLTSSIQRVHLYFFYSQSKDQHTCLHCCPEQNGGEFPTTHGHQTRQPRTLSLGPQYTTPYVPGPGTGSFSPAFLLFISVIGSPFIRMANNFQGK